MTDGPGEGLYRALLRAYPRRFRDSYRRELLEAFRYRRGLELERRPRLGFRFWAFILRDLTDSAWREWRHPVYDGASTEAARTPRGGDGIMGWVNDLLYAGRRLARSPGFTATALVILILGIGVNTTAFSVVNALLFQPPPFADPEEVVLILQDSDGGSPNSTSYPAYLDIERTPGVFASVSAFSGEQAFLSQDEALTPIQVEYATSAYLDVIGLSTSRGSWFDALADDPSGPPLAVLTHKMWSDRLGQDPDVLGSTLRIGGGAVTVVGVGPEEFNGGLGPATVDMWLSISAMRVTGGRAASLTRRQDHPFRVRARLAPGVSEEEATAAMDRLAAELAATYPELNANRGISVLPVLSNRVTPEADAQMVPVAALTMGVVVLVLLIGTLNLANLLFVRSMSRARELAVRLALGAGRSRIVRVVLSEAILLSMVGGLGGVLGAAWIASMISNSRFDFVLPISPDIRLDVRVLLFALAISVVTGLVIGLLPALRASARPMTESLREDAGTKIGARRRFGLTGSLVAGQIAVSLLLLSVAGVFLESFARAQGSDPGFAWEEIGYVRIGTQQLQLSGEDAGALHEELAARIAARPEIRRVTSSAQLPAAIYGTTTLLLGSGNGGVDAPTETPWNVVPENFFDVMDIELLHGRTFDVSDRTGPTVAIVSAAMARTYWGRTDVVGESYRSESSPEDAVEIVGVVEDVTVRSLGEASRPALYWARPGAMALGYVLFEAAGPVDQAVIAATAAVADVDDRIMIFDASTLADHLGGTLEQQRLAGTLLGGLGTLALLLAILGVYGVVSFAVSRRRQEVGVRIALGAGRQSVVGLFVRDVAGVILAGAAVGLVLSIPLVRLVGQLFTGTAGRPLIGGVGALLLISTALAATVVPALRATRTDPTEALRQD